MIGSEIENAKCGHHLKLLSGSTFLCSSALNMASVVTLISRA